MTLAGVTLAVEVAFEAGLYDTDPAWTDVSAYVKSVATKRGRSNEVGVIEAGTATIALDNADGRFTPHRLASPSPYAGNILPRRQVRIRALVAEVSHPLWTGFTERWSFTHPGGTDYSEASLDCVDGLKILGDHVMLDYYGEYIKSTGPTAYYPLFEPSGSIWFNDYSGHNLPVGVFYHRSDSDKSTPGADQLLYNSGSTSVSFDTEGASAGADIDLTATLDTNRALRLLPTQGTIVCWLKMSAQTYNSSPPTPPETHPAPSSPVTPAPIPASAPRNVTVNVTSDPGADLYIHLVPQYALGLGGLLNPPMRDTPHASEGSDNDRRDYQMHGGDNLYWFDPDDGLYITLEYLAGDPVAHIGLQGVCNNDNGNQMLATAQDWASHTQVPNELTSDGPPFAEGGTCTLHVVLEGAGTLGTYISGFENQSTDLVCTGDKTTLTFDLGSAANPVTWLGCPFMFTASAGDVDMNDEEATGLRVHAAWITGTGVSAATAHYAWDAPEDDGGCAVDLYRALDTAGNIVYQGSDSTFTLSPIDPGAGNQIRVMAHNCRGWGALSVRSPRTGGPP